MSAQSLDELVSFVLKEAEKRFDDAVIHASRSQSRQLKFTNNGLSTGRLWMDQSAELFVAKGKKVASATLKELSQEEVKKSIAKLEKLIARCKPNEEYNGIADSGFRKQDVMNLYDARVEKLTGEELVDFVEGGINAALSEGAERASGVIETETAREILKSSGGAKCAQKGTSITFSIRAFVGKEASGHKLSCARVMQHFKPEEAGSRAGELAVKSVGAKPCEAGKYDVVFDPLAAAVLMQHVGEAASIFAVEAGLSFFEGKLNKRVGSDILTVFDDGTLPGGMASTNFDAEGIPTQKTTIIRFGILRNYLHSTGTAKRYGVLTTGNAGILHPHPWNVVVDKGNYEVPELVREVKRGLYISNAWYMRFHNYRTGDFSVMPRDAMFYIENGEIKHPVNHLRLSENMLNFLSSVEALSETREQIVGWEVEIPVKCGHILAKNLNFTKSVGASGGEQVI